MMMTTTPPAPDAASEPQEEKKKKKKSRLIQRGSMTRTMMMSPETTVSESSSYCSLSSSKLVGITTPDSSTFTAASSSGGAVDSSYYEKNDATADGQTTNNKNSNHVRVIARIRPMNEDEARRGCRPCIYPEETHQEEEEGQENKNNVAASGGLDGVGSKDIGGSSNNYSSSTSSFGLLSRLGGSIRNSFNSPPPTLANNNNRNDETEDGGGLVETFDEGIVLADSTPHAMSNVNRTLYRRDSISPVPPPPTLPSTTKSTSRLQSPTSSKIKSPTPVPQSATKAKANKLSPTPPPRRPGSCKRLIAEPSSTSGSNNNTKKRSFDFDAVLSSKATQRDVYEVAVGDSVRRNVLRGYHTTILAYGQTGSGKTHTMAGSNSTPGQDGDGIIGRALQELFTAKDELTAGGNHNVTLRLSCMEIYQEELRDLLAVGNTAETNNNLQLRDHGERRGCGGGGVEVRGLTNVVVDSIDRVHDLMDHATKRRTTATTKLNERSSRSHAIYTVSATIAPKRTPKNKRDKKSATTTAKLTFIDLAGSERMKKTGAEGERAQEGININKDLFVLGKVVSALAEKARFRQQGKKKASSSIHVPYRDSKLTRLLRDSLGGNCCTVLIACVSPADVNADESINTLRYAERSRKITNSIKRNVVGGGAANTLTPAQCASLRAENKCLKAQVLILQKRIIECLGGETTTAPIKVNKGDDNNNNKLPVSFNEELVRGLYAKLRLAEEQARVARENSRSVAQTACRWREHCENYNNNNERNRSTTNAADTPSSDCTEFGSVVSPCLSYELSVAEEDEECSLIGDDDSFLDMEITTKKSLSEDDLMQLKVEVEALGNEKSLMKESLLELSDQIESKRSDLEKMEDDYDQRQSALEDEIEREEKNRDEILQEISKLKEHLQSLETYSSSSASGNHPTAKGLRSLVRGFAAAGVDSGNNKTNLTDTRHVTDEDEDEMVEMRTLSLSSSSISKNSNKKGATAMAESEGMALARELGRSLGEERTRCEELQGQVTNLEKSLASQQDQNVKLLNSNKALAEEVAALKAKFRIALDNQDDKQSKNDSNPIMRDLGDMQGSNEHMIKSRAEKILKDLGAIGAGASTSICNSMVSSMCTTDLADGGIADERSETKPAVLISNIDEADKCNCETSIFGENAEHIDFYLPKLGVPCDCGRDNNNSSTYVHGVPEDLCALENILRPWQCAFIKSVGIQCSAVEFVHAFKQRGTILAKDLRRWRKEKQMPPVRTKSCRVALHIWHRTCKSVIKYVREQQIQYRGGVVADGSNRPLILQKPDFLQVSFANAGDMNTVSTLGVDSTIFPTGTHNDDELYENEESHLIHV